MKLLTRVDPGTATALMLLMTLAACRHHSADRQAPGASASARTPGRGARVVVEQTAAEFFEGRVLAASGGTLRVQTSGAGETRRVDAEDAYLLPPPRSDFRVGDLAICRAGVGRWVGCKIARLAAGGIDAVDPEGRSVHVEPDGVIKPSPVTLMNLGHRFEREHERHDFLLAVRRAGRPVAPAGWHASPHERILALRGSRWYSADVREIDKDTLHVVWRFDGRETEVPAGQVVPEPPQGAAIHAGDFVLVRPPSLAEAWVPCRVATVADGNFTVVDIEGKRQSVDDRDLLPLRP